MVKNRKHYSDEARLGLVRSYYESASSHTLSATLGLCLLI